MNSVDHKSNARSVLFWTTAGILLLLAGYLYITDGPNRIASKFEPALEKCQQSAALARAQLRTLLETYEINEIPQPTKQEIQDCLG
ncbi:MAG: hypothetical protein JJ894_03335 [Dinoroseobacter sp.]|nr:hypothetical protein [Dinoroseobacter sp.]